MIFFVFFFQAEDGIRDLTVTGVQTCALPISIVQSSVRRLLAYSAIAHAGYMLLGILTHNAQGLSSLVYYVVTYGLTAVGAFGVVSVVQDQTGSDKLSNFAGLSRRAPILSFCMLIFILS